MKRSRIKGEIPALSKRCTQRLVLASSGAGHHASWDAVIDTTRDQSANLLQDSLPTFTAHSLGGIDCCVPELECEYELHPYLSLGPPSTLLKTNAGDINSRDLSLAKLTAP